MKNNDLIPVVVAVTGHRRIVSDDIPELKSQVKASLERIVQLCKGQGGAPDTPIIMLNGFAQGADTLCAEVAFDMDVPVYAVLPCDRQTFAKSYDEGHPDADKLFANLDRCERIIYAPDMECNRDFFKQNSEYDNDSYGYRQVGIYMAEHAHVVLALWDGEPPLTKFGCGTVEVINFALTHDFVEKEQNLTSGIINDTAVVWINTRRAGTATKPTIDSRWLVSKLTQEEAGEAYGEYLLLSEPPQSFVEVVDKTVSYNSACLKGANAVDYGKLTLWKDVDGLDGYHQNVRRHFIKADGLSYSVNQAKYNKFLLALAIIGAVLASAFLMYDDANLPWMIIPCTVAVVALIALTGVGHKRKYHFNFINYRAFAEALRIQFYLTLCTKQSGDIFNVCQLYAWSQRAEMIWVHKALQSIAVISERNPELAVNLDEVKEAWIGNGAKPEGQLHYHTRKYPVNKKQQVRIEKVSGALEWCTIALYFAILAMEVISFVLKACGIGFFWEGNAVGDVSWRAVFAICVGTLAVVSLFLSSFWGKMSFDRKTDDNVKMCKFYASAYKRWTDTANSKYSNADFDKFVKEIAREEIVENGIWCSYVAENTLDITM